MARPSKFGKARRPDCAGTQVWGYPAGESLTEDIRFAWACRCGKNGAGHKDVSAAESEAREHLRLRGSAETLEILPQFQKLNGERRSVFSRARATTQRSD